MHQAPVVWERWNVAELRWGCYILRYMLGVLWQAWVRFALRAPLSQICDIYMHFVKLTSGRTENFSSYLTYIIRYVLS